MGYIRSVRDETDAKNFAYSIGFIGVYRYASNMGFPGDRHVPLWSSLEWLQPRIAPPFLWLVQPQSSGATVGSTKNYLYYKSGDVSRYVALLVSR